jgi:hypothetical protein
MEAAKAWYQRERERERTDPFRALWREMVRRAYETDAGFEGFSGPEREYFAVGLLQGEVYNGGFDQYFHNSSGDYYQHAVAGLTAMNAVQSLDLLRRAKQVLFAFGEPPPETERRRAVLRRSRDESVSQRLTMLDSLFCEDPDSLSSRAEQFAGDRRLVDVAEQPVAADGDR